MGYTTRGQLFRVYLPIALPAMFAGMRVATVTVIGLVTVTVFIGRSNLGSMILLGFNLRPSTRRSSSALALSKSITRPAPSVAATFVVLERFTVRWTRTRTRTSD